MKRLALIFLILPMFTTAQDVFNDASIEAGQTVTLSGEYILDGLVYVEEGATLVIEPGTVIRARQTPDSGDNTSALIITRGAKIMARGTASQPIIFTAEADDLSNPSDLTFEDRGLWGGLIILGHATTNRGIEGQIEGIPTTEARTIYGGDNDRDNSGIVRYVSIRHGGAELAPGDEINGLTLGAVGDGTTIEFVEVFANLDDGVEWFGGTVNTRNIAVAFCGDDAYDYDEGWRGMNQFWLAVQGPDFAGRIGEHDGGTVDETGTPYAQPHVYNATYIGPGTANFPQGDGDAVLLFRDNAGGHYANSIFTDYNGEGGGAGILVEDIDGEDSRSRLENGQLSLKNNIWFGFADGNGLDQFAPQDFVQTHLAANNNQIVNPNLNNISRTNDNGFDPRPSAGSAAANGAMAPANSFFEPVAYIGAFSPNGELWTDGWTALSAENHTAQDTLPVINDASIGPGESLVLDGEYILDGLVYVEDGSSLVIMPGTVLYARAVPSNGDNTTALIIARGGSIYADGTAANPIIMTAESDDLANPSDLTYEDRGLWGGLIVLGHATTNRGIEGQIEGIPTTEARTVYGGNDDHDDSGVIRYLSIRHGGAELAPGDEINGLTLGAVGDRTIIENVEVFANLDDGVEWFGGTVNTRYLAVAFCGDDAFDYDEGWRGKNQFWFAIQGDDFAGRIGEHDGGTVDETGTPYAQPHIHNATLIGPGIGAFPQGDGDTALLFRDNAGGHYANSIITDFNGEGGGAGIKVEDIDGEDSRSRMENGQLTLSNNIWHLFADGNDLTSFAPQDFVQAHLAAKNNTIGDPSLRSISRVPDHQLDPRPSAAGLAATGAVAPSDSFFDRVSYRGAFAPNGENWLNGWTALWAEGHLAASSELPQDGLWLNHITRLGGEFTTRIVMVNSTSETQAVSLAGYNQAGGHAADDSRNIPGNTVVDLDSTEFFGNVDVSHVIARAPEGVSVAVAYKVATGTGASAVVNGSTTSGTGFVVIPGEAEVVFDGLALVNQGSAAANVTVTYLDASGAVLDSAVIADALAPMAKALYAFATPAGTASVRVESSQKAGAVFLRGTQPGVEGASFLYEVVPTSIQD